jgi:hypothetical protein
MTHPHREFNPDPVPLGYLITFRAYGTWLHGDSRGPSTASIIATVRH